MSTKFTITLSYPHLAKVGHDYRVVQIEQSTEFKPGQMLSEKEVDELCRRPSWKVITKYNSGPR